MESFNYDNPCAWGISPLSDQALRMQQLQVEQPEVWNQMVQDDLEALNARLDSEMDEIIEALNNGQPYRANVYRSHADSKFYFASLEDAQAYIAQSISVDTEENLLEGISLETLQDGEWVDTGFTIEDALSMAQNENPIEYLHFLLDTDNNNDFSDEENLAGWISEVRGAEETIYSWLFETIEDIQANGVSEEMFNKLLGNNVNVGVAYIAAMGNQSALLACDESEIEPATEIYYSYCRT